TDLNGIAGMGGRVVAVGAKGTVLDWTGTAWNAAAPFTDADLFAVSRTANDGWIVGARGTIARGATTRALVSSSATFSRLMGVWASAEDDAWAIGADGTLVRWDGNAWTRVMSSATAGLRAVWGSAKADVWAVGENFTILHFDGTSWTKLT